MKNPIWFNLEIHTNEGHEEIIEALRNQLPIASKIFDEDCSTIERIEWETINKDMKTFSLQYPGVEFEFTCDDERGNLWREWYKDGKSAYAEPEIVYPSSDKVKWC